MTPTYRLSTVARHKMEDAAHADRVLRQELVQDVGRGEIPVCVAQRLIDDLDVLDMDVYRALVASVESDVVAAVNDYRSKVGLDKPFHQYLKEKVQDLDRMKAHLAGMEAAYIAKHGPALSADDEDEKPKPPPAMTARVVLKGRKARGEQPQTFLADHKASVRGER